MTRPRPIHYSLTDLVEAAIRVLRPPTRGRWVTLRLYPGRVWRVRSFYDRAWIAKSDAVMPQPARIVGRGFPFIVRRRAITVYRPRRKR